MSFRLPYRAIICGDEHIVKGWRGQKLLTDKGSFSVRHIYGNWEIHNHRILEVAMIQSDGENVWIVNGKPLSIVEKLPMGLRFQNIPTDETLRVHKNKIQAVVWFDLSGSSPKITELLDEIKGSWGFSALPLKEKDEEPTISRAILQFTTSLAEITKYRDLFTTWSNPVWLTQFRTAGKRIAITPDQKKLAISAAELHTTKEQLRKAEAAASNTLREALSKWMQFNPPRMSADTKARIEKAVKLYVTDRENMGSFAKIAAEFGVSRKTVSVWFEQFRKETGYQVVRHIRHESVTEHLQANSVQEEEE